MSGEINDWVEVPTEEIDDWVEVTPSEPTAPEVSKLESAARGAAQGLSLGFSDEVTAGAEALFTDKTYDQALQESRLNYAAAKDANPITYHGSEFVGSMALPGGVVAKGAIAGAGLSQGETLGDVAGDAALGGLIGAGVKALPGVAKVATGAVKGGLSAGLHALEQPSVMMGLGKVGSETVRGAAQGAAKAVAPAGLAAKMNYTLLADKIRQVAQAAPERLGKFAGTIRDALSRGNHSFATTNFLLSQQSPEYREMIKDLDKEQE